MKIQQLLESDLNTTSEESQINAVQYNPTWIDKITNPSERVQLAAIQSRAPWPQPGSGDFGRYKQDEILKLILKKGIVPSKRVQLAAVKVYGLAILTLINHGIMPSEQAQLAVVKSDPLVLEHIPNPSERVQMAAVHTYGNAIEFIPNPSEAMCLVAVQRPNTDAIRYIPNPSEAVQLASVKQMASSIGHIKNPTEAVQLAAVQKSTKSFKYIANPTHRATMTAFLNMSYRDWATRPGNKSLMISELRRMYRLHPDWDDLHTFADDIGIKL